METPLSQREFDTWREGDETYKHVMQNFVNTQSAFNLKIVDRVSAVEAKQEDCESSLGRRSGLISGVVAAIVGAIGAWLATVFTS